MSGPVKTESSSRFQPGRSGNPKGRPRKAKPELTSAFDVITDKTFTVTTGGAQRVLSVDEALQQRIYQDALAGSRIAIRTVLGWISKREAARAAKQPIRHSVALLHEFGDPRNIDDALVLLGIATEQPQPSEVATDRRLLLEPWATQLALSGRGMCTPSNKDLEEGKRCTRDSESIRWPEASGE